MSWPKTLEIRRHRAHGLCSETGGEPRCSRAQYWPWLYQRLIRHGLSCFALIRFIALLVCAPPFYMTPSNHFFTHTHTHPTRLLYMKFEGSILTLFCQLRYGFIHAHTCTGLQLHFSLLHARVLCLDLVQPVLALLYGVAK